MSSGTRLNPSSTCHLPSLIPTLISNPTTTSLIPTSLINPTSTVIVTNNLLLQHKPPMIDSTHFTTKAVTFPHKLSNCLRVAIDSTDSISFLCECASEAQNNIFNCPVGVPGLWVVTTECCTDVDICFISA